MATAAELRGEAHELRESVAKLTDPIAIAAMWELITELEDRARKLGNGTGDGDALD